MTQILSATVSKSISSSVIDIIANIRFTSSDDVRGTAYLHDGTSYIDQIEVFMNGSGGTFKAPLAFSRSEEHTSALQSLMRISYAVFCLKKKKTNNHNTNHNIMLNIYPTKPSCIPKYH